MELVFDIVADAVIDTLYLIPFLFVTYVAMEWLEHSASHKFQQAIQRGGAVGPVVGAVLGVVPQCGFSAAASTLYAARVITLGTLIAVFLSTSDEMLPIFIAEAVPAQTIALILLTKIALGMVCGLVLDAVLRITSPVREGMRIHELCDRAGCHCDDDDIECIEAWEAREVANAADAKAAEPIAPTVGENHQHNEHGHSHGHAGKRGKWRSIVRSAALHTGQVTLFVFLVVLALNAVFALVGEDALAQAIAASPQAAVLVSALVGLVPNCAASVAIAQLYVDGLLSAGAMMSGLLCAAGVGLLVLFRTNQPLSRNVAIVAIMLILSCLSGFAIDALGVVFPL